MEILVLLDQHWSFKLRSGPSMGVSPEQRWPYPLCLVSRTAQDMIAFARSLIEWMGGVLRDFGEEDVMAAGARRGRRRGRPNVGSEYGALEFL